MITLSAQERLVAPATTSVNRQGPIVSAAVIPGATFAVGAHTVLFSTAGLRANTYVVEPGDKRFVMMRPVSAGTAAGSQTEQLVQIANWLSELETKLAGRSP